MTRTVTLNSRVYFIDLTQSGTAIVSTRQTPRLVRPVSDAEAARVMKGLRLKIVEG